MYYRVLYKEKDRLILQSCSEEELKNIPKEQIEYVTDMNGDIVVDNRKKEVN